MNNIVILVLTLGLSGCNDDMSFLNLDIPIRYVVDAMSPAHLSGYEGDEEETSVTLRIPIEELTGLESRTFMNREISSQLLSLTQVNAQETRQSERRIWEQMTSHSDRFREAYSEADAATGLMKVFPSRDITFTWHLVTRDPYENSNVDANEFGEVVGVCSEKGHGATCSIKFTIDDTLLVEISSLDYQYLRDFNELKRKIERMILSWRRE
jgi:hypothetical protein